MCWPIRTVEKRLRHWSFAIARRLEENRIRSVMRGLFHNRHFFSRPAGIVVSLNRHKTVHNSTAVGTTEIG